MSEPSAPAPTPQAQQETRCYHDAGHRVIHGVRVGFYEGGDVAPMFGGRCDLIAAPHVARAATARAAGGTDGEALPEDDRDPECVARWPECASFGYDPRCCRFPKACSCEMDDLPARAAGAGAAPECDWGICHEVLREKDRTEAGERLCLAGHVQSAPDDEAIERAAMAMYRVWRWARLPHPPQWPALGGSDKDEWRAYASAGFGAALAAVRAELAEVREAFQNGVHQEEDDGRCICGNEWICPRWAEPTPEDFADAMDQVAARDAVIAAVRALADEATPGTGTRIAYVTVAALRRALGSSTGTGSSDE